MEESSEEHIDLLEAGKDSAEAFEPPKHLDLDLDGSRIRSCYDSALCGEQLMAVKKHPSNRPSELDTDKCAKPIMRQEYISIFRGMGESLGINPLFIMSTALQESGWDLVHVFGTNSSSNGKPLNNLFGMTQAGGNNIAYPNVQASADAWMKNWGPFLSAKPKTIEDYAKALVSNKRHMYNASPAYPNEIAKRYKQLLKATAACGINLSGDADAKK